jgi:hypothetical protein
MVNYPKIAARFRALYDPTTLLRKIHSSNNAFWKQLSSSTTAYKTLNNELTNFDIRSYDDKLEPLYIFFFQQHRFKIDDLFHHKKVWNSLSLWKKFGETVGLIPKIVQTKNLLMSVTHAAFYCFRKIEILRSVGAKTTDHHLFRDPIFDQDDLDEESEDSDQEISSYDSIDAELKKLKKKCRVSGFTFFKLALLVIMKRVVDSKAWIRKFGKTKIIGSMSGLTNFSIDGYGGAGSLEKQFVDFVEDQFLVKFQFSQKLLRKYSTSIKGL